MSKYCFERLGSARFETLAQALLENLFRTFGELSQFGSGKDGAREATWTQPCAHESYVRPLNEKRDVPKQWVFQAKFHDIGLRGWGAARTAVEAELEAELEKVVTKYKVPCHKYIMLTNVPFSGVRNVGTRDRVAAVIQRWKDEVPEIEVWDAVDLSRMLDADPSVRTTYLGDVLPGDVLRALIEDRTAEQKAKNAICKAYLKSILRTQSEARADEAGDEDKLRLESVFVDLDLRLDTKSVVQPELAGSAESHPVAMSGRRMRGETLYPASFGLIRAASQYTFIMGGPGAGKSTLTQFLVLYHAARMVEPALSKRLAERLNLTGGISPADLEASCHVRIPFRVELRRYAQWMETKSEGKYLALYLAEQIGKAASMDYAVEDLFGLVQANPTLLVLDGLDEVPHPQLRRTIFAELDRFLDGCSGHEADLQLIMSSRPQGYRGEFDSFDPVTWAVADLDRAKFDQYVKSWLAQRVPEEDERLDATARIDDGMTSRAVQQLATTLLQATVMLTIVRRKHAIPHARHKLYERYVDVIFDREKSREMVREREGDLRRLHELVGYRLMNGLESPTGVEVLSEAMFRGCVRKVLDEYGSCEIRGKLSAVVDQIMLQAKDRLCLLAGKGEAQENVDFVIQPFREFFAAAFMHTHADGAPERAHYALVRRQHVYANVLQFYCAFQSNAVQKGLVGAADGSGMDLSDVENVIEVVRMRRGLVRVLPEFRRPRKPDLARTLRVVMSADTRWTWPVSGGVARSLRAFAGVDAFATLREVLGDVETDEHGALAFELDLLAKLASCDADERYVSDLLAGMLSGPRQNIALRVAGLNDLPLECSGCDSEPFTALGGTAELYDLGGRFVEGLEPQHVLAMLFAWWMPVADEGGSRGTVHSWMFELWDCLRGVDGREGESGPIEFSPWLLELPTESAELWLQKLRAVPGNQAAYLAAILEARAEPENLSLVSRVHALWVELGEKPEFLDAHAQVGGMLLPDATENEWVRERRVARATWVDTADSWRDFLQRVDGGWLTCFFHPKVWGALGLSSEDERRALEEGVLRVSPSKALSTQLVSRIDGEAAAKLVEAICDVSKSFPGQEHLFPGRQVFQLLSFRGLSWADVAKPEERLKTAVANSAPHPLIGILVRVCAGRENASLEELLPAWRVVMDSGGVQWLYNRHSPSVELVLKAISVGTLESVTLAAFLTSVDPGIHEVGESCLDRHALENLAESLCGYVRKASEAQKVALFGHLVRQPLTVPELRILADEGAGCFGGDTRLLRRFPRRFAQLPSVYDEASYEPVRYQCCRLVERRDIVGDVIAQAALNAVLRMDEVRMEPLREEDWQVKAEG